MTEEQLVRLINDAELVVEASTVLGQLKVSTDLVGRLAALQDRPQGVMPAEQQIGALRVALSEAIAALAPVTLGDLRNGWHPFRRSTWDRFQLAFLAVGCLLLLAVTGYMTMAYDRVSTFFLTTKELQTSQGGELATKLYSLLRKSAPQDIVDIKDERLYDEFMRQLMNLHQINKKIASYSEINAEIENDVWLLGTFTKKIIRRR